MSENTAPDTSNTPVPASPQKPLRLWPAPIILLIQVVTIGISISPGINGAVRFGYMIGGPAVCVLLFLIWILGFSRLPWRERVGAPLAALGLALLTALFVHESMPVAMWNYGAPLAMLAISVGLWAARARAPKPRFAAVAVLLLLGWSIFPFMRLDGFDGDYLPEFAWRASPTPESAIAGQLAARSVDPAQQAANAAWKATTIEWPRFRGPDANSRVANSGAHLPWPGEPKVLWRIPAGPAWSSFAHVSDRLFTQEQREEEEAVTCVDSATGKLLWQTKIPCRFTDVVAGAGPRATPSFVDGRLYTFGAKANLLCLDAATGAIQWQHDLMAEVNAQLPVWGFSSSPLTVGSLVIIYAGGDGDNGLIAFDQLSGAVAWRYASHDMNFSSPQPIKIADKEMVLFADGDGLVALEPATGAVVWKHKPSGWRGPAICQPQQVGPASLIVPLGDGVGVMRLELAQDGGNWKVTEGWTSKKLKPNYNDFIYHDGHCYGFDNHIFVCIDAATGEQKWQHKGYGFGQAILLEDARTLIVTTEKGELALVAADPAQFRELGHYPLLKGKTWNHPIAAAGRLFVRNGEECVAIAL